MGQGIGANQHATLVVLRTKLEYERAWVHGAVGLHGIWLPPLKAADARNQGTPPHHTLRHVAMQHKALCSGPAKGVQGMQVSPRKKPGQMAPRPTDSRRDRLRGKRCVSCRSERMACTLCRRRIRGRDVHHSWCHLATLGLNIYDFSTWAASTGSNVGIHLEVGQLAIMLPAPGIIQSSRSSCAS